MSPGRPVSAIYFRFNERYLIQFERGLGATFKLRTKYQINLTVSTRRIHGALWGAIDMSEQKKLQRSGLVARLDVDKTILQGTVMGKRPGIQR